MLDLTFKVFNMNQQNNIFPNLFIDIESQF